VRFALCIKEDVSRLDVTMQDAVFMRVVHGACRLCDEFHRLPDGHRRVFNYFVKLTAFDKLHAEVALPIALAYLVNRDDAWIIQARSSFCFQAKALEVRFGGPLPKANDF
jgi:hypothetical protein